MFNLAAQAVCGGFEMVGNMLRKQKTDAGETMAAVDEEAAIAAAAVRAQGPRVLQPWPLTMALPAEQAAPRCDASAPVPASEKKVDKVMKPGGSGAPNVVPGITTKHAAHASLKAASPAGPKSLCLALRCCEGQL